MLKLVRIERRLQPKLGTRKLKHRIDSMLLKMGIRVGRDRFFGILRENGLLLKPKKKYVRTTDSFHNFRIYDNLIKTAVIYGPEQAIAADITYIRTNQGFMYLSLLTDLYSRKILGYDLSDSLSIEGSIRTLKMALSKIDNKEVLIHHSDRGIQYCSNEYIKILKTDKIKISMAEKGNPYENAVAERVNGILKIEYMLDETFNTQEDASRAVDQAVWLYNNLRPHLSLGYLTPEEVHCSFKTAA